MYVLRKLLVVCVLLVTASCATDPAITGSEAAAHALTASGIVVRHRSGQSFVTWDEAHPKAHYHVYRSDQPIRSSADLAVAEQLTSRWGPLDENTSMNRYGPDHAPEFFVIEDLAKPLDNDTALFVHTTQTPAAAYYAVTTVMRGYENRTVVPEFNATMFAVDEMVQTPRSVLTTSVNDGKGRLYTQYMDYSRWNPTFNGYAYNYSLALPANYDEQQSYPLQLALHVFGSQAKFIEQSENEQPVVQLFANDPGESSGVNHSWWYGYARDHNYKTQGPYPRAGSIENFTEQRLLQAINEVAGNFSVDADLVHVTGNSMGASGALSLGIRHADVFAGIYASQPMTNYAASPLFQENFKRLWGSRKINLPIVNRGLSGKLVDAEAGPDNRDEPGIGVWDWMNHQQQLRRRHAGRFAFLMMDFGKADNVIDWRTQGRPMFAALADAKVAYSATAAGGVGHEWRDFEAVNTGLFGLGKGSTDVWRYPKSQSFPALHNASGSGDVRPGAWGDDSYNMSIDWSVAGNLFHKPVVDNVNRYEITLRSSAGNQTVDVTPRNTHLFKPAAGRKCQWQTLGVRPGTTLESVTSSGSGLVADDSLFTALQVPVGQAGTRLVVNC